MHRLGLLEVNLLTLGRLIIYNC